MPDTIDMPSSIEGERISREKEVSISGGKDVWRRGCEDVEALRRFMAGADVGMSVDLLFGADGNEEGVERVGECARLAE